MSLLLGACAIYPTPNGRALLVNTSVVDVTWEGENRREIVLSPHDSLGDRFTLERAEDPERAELRVVDDVAEGKRATFWGNLLRYAVGFVGGFLAGSSGSAP